MKKNTNNKRFNTVDQVYKMKQEQVKNLMKAISEKMKQHSKRQSQNQNDYGFVRDLNHMLSDLENINQHMIYSN